MKVITAPTSLDCITKNSYTYFLAGSIEQGKASLWQDVIINIIKKQYKIEKKFFDNLTDYFILNPRRKVWHPEWKQSIENKHFYNQVHWEIDGLELCDKVIFYFDPSTKSPISLLELGLVLGMDKINVDIICPKNFYRRGNVEVMCNRYSHSFYENIEEFEQHFKIPIKYKRKDT